MSINAVNEKPYTEQTYFAEARANSFSRYAQSDSKRSGEEFSRRPMICGFSFAMYCMSGA